MNKYFAAALMGVQAASALKIVTLSDPHMFPQYDPANSASGFCWPGSGEPLDTPAYFGQVGCDPPVGLVRVMFEKLKNDHPDLEVMFLTGDLVAHAVALEPPPKKDFSTSSYEHTLEILSLFAGLLHEFFPDVVVLPTQGNNDDKYHYQPSVGDYATSYYELYFNYYFEQHPANARLADLASIKETFVQGAYFKAQIDAHLYAISLNTLAYNVEDVSDDSELKNTQLQWLKDTLAAAQPEDKFILMSHIYETVGGETFIFELNWTEDSY